MATIIELACKAVVFTRPDLRTQYTKDEHYVYCPHCDVAKRVNKNKAIATAWQKVTNFELTALRDVPERTTEILPDRILRIQPTVPKHRIWPFPYK